MARLPSMRYLIQQIGGTVILFEEGSEREIVRFDPSDADATARAQATIYGSDLNDEDKCFAHFWSGYFHAHASRGMELPHSFLPGRRTTTDDSLYEPVKYQDVLDMHDGDDPSR